MCACSQEGLPMTLGDSLFKTRPSVCVWWWFKRHSRSFDLCHSSRWYLHVCRCGCKDWAQTTGSRVWFPLHPRLSIRLVCASAECKMSIHGAESLDRHWQIQSWSNEQISTGKERRGENATYLKMEHYREDSLVIWGFNYIWSGLN